MNLFTNANATFTNWVVKAGLLREPFVLVDVGVQGGESRSWHRLGDYLVVHGFDAIEEAIEQLRKRTGHVPNRHYHRIAAGNADEERVFHFNPANPTASSMYAQGASRFEVPAGQQTRSVTVRRLDTLFAEGLIPQVDFLKVDVEGFEKDVLLGANDLLARVPARRFGGRETARAQGPPRVTSRRCLIVLPLVPAPAPGSGDQELKSEIGFRPSKSA